MDKISPYSEDAHGFSLHCKERQSAAMRWGTEKGKKEETAPEMNKNPRNELKLKYVQNTYTTFSLNAFVTLHSLQ